MNFNWRNIFKSWAGVPVLILVVLAVVWLFTNGLPGYKIWQAKRAYEKLSEPYYKDTYGGKTPEETYDLFIDALKKGDVELASKYFVLEKQDDWLKTFNELKENESLASYIIEIEQNREKWSLKNRDEKTTSFIYQYSRENAETVELPISGDQTQKLILPAGIFNGEVSFSRYLTGLWKIEFI